jgi:hypothetical protein
MNAAKYSSVGAVTFAVSLAHAVKPAVRNTNSQGLGSIATANQTKDAKTISFNVPSGAPWTNTTDIDGTSQRRFPPRFTSKAPLMFRVCFLTPHGGTTIKGPVTIWKDTN